MKTHSYAIKALTAFTVGGLLVACGSGTSKSSSDNLSNTGNSVDQQAPAVNLSLIEITGDNYTHVTSQSLKSLLLNDAGTNALNRSVRVTGGAIQDPAKVATGIVITLLPYPCLTGGQMAFRAEIKDANSNQQINYNNPLHIDFSTEFNNCNQGGNTLDGNVNLQIDGNLSELINGGGYSLSSSLRTDDLFIEQVGMPALTLAGEFDYNVASDDGVTVVTSISSTNSLYTADMLYQMIDFYVEKTVNNATQAYTYQVASEFTDFYSADKKVAYATVEPLTGVGFALPSGGSIAVTGVNSSVMVYVEDAESLRLELDLGNNGVIDDVHYTDWHELVLSAFDNVQL